MKGSLEQRLSLGLVMGEEVKESVVSAGYQTFYILNSVDFFWLCTTSTTSLKIPIWEATDNAIGKWQILARHINLSSRLLSKHIILSSRPLALKVLHLLIWGEQQSFRALDGEWLLAST